MFRTSGAAGAEQPGGQAINIRPRLNAAFAVLILALSLAACLSTKVETLAPNMARLNMTADDTPSDSGALKEVLTVAAKETLARGYTHFRFADLAVAPVRSLTSNEPAKANFSVILVMFHEGEQGTQGVFDARRILEMNTPQQ